MKARLLLIPMLCCVALVARVDASDIRVGVHADADNGLTGKLVSALSREVRALQGVVVTDDQPQFRLSCSVITIDLRATRVGYAASVAIASGDGHLLSHFVHVDDSLESLAHEVALAFDGHTIEPVRRAAATPPVAR
jgi:hypothetical protein